MQDVFRRFAGVVSRRFGSVWTVLLVIGLVLGTGLYFDFSNAWKTNVSVISTVTALLLLIVLQKSQNHCDKATHLKLDELIQAAEGARNEIAASENQTEKEIDDLKHR